MSAIFSFRKIDLFHSHFLAVGLLITFGLQVLSGLRLIGNGHLIWFKIAQTKATSFLKSMSERGGSDIERL